MPRLLAGVLCLLPCLVSAQTRGPDTLTYWIGVREAVGKDEFVRTTHQFDQPLDVRRGNECRDLERLPTAGVDPELVGFVKQLLSYAEGKAKADATLRWYHGYWAKLPAEVVEIRKTKDALVAEAKRLRDVMTKRHGVTFPPFEFPDW